jgi:rfaE bifunctional protein nucleotidyltransferase chain/domain
MNSSKPSLNLVGGVGSVSPAEAKILSLEQLLASRAQARTAGLKVVHCHGCFDIVHPGHLRHLRHAKAQGDLLLVSITGDSLINKGNGRPLIPQELRAENLAALDCVDWVYIEPRPTAAELLGEVQPDIYVKGREYEFNNDPRFKAEQEIVTRHGGRVVFSSGDVVFSSTALIAALEQSADPYHARMKVLLQTPELEGERLTKVVSGFRGKRVVVVGDTIVDSYVLCDRPDVAAESPIMTLRPVERRHYDGGAAIIARHLAAMGAQPTLVTGLPRSPEADALRNRLIAEGVSVRAIELDTPLAEKQRFLVGAQKVMKLDLVERIELDSAKQDELVGLAAEAAGERGGCDAAILADFGLGLLTQGSLGKLCTALRPKAAVMAGDVSGRRANLRAMRDMDLLCPSESEIRDAFHLFDQGLPMVAWRLLSDTKCGAAIVTMGAEGLITFDRLPSAGDDENWGTKMKSEHVPAMSQHAIDSLGCGDALLSAATLGLCSGAGLLPSAFLGAIAAAVQVQRLGNTVINGTDLRHGVVRLHTSHLAYASSEVIESRGSARLVTSGLRKMGAKAS